MRDAPGAGVTPPTTPPRPALVAAALLAVTATLVVWSSVEFMVVALQDEFRLSADRTMVVIQIGPAACLAVVFLAGALADRFGPRPVLLGASATFAAGAVVVAVSPTVLVLGLGLAIAGIGAIALAIVGLAVLDRVSPDRRHRAHGFGAFALMAPLVSIAVPLSVGVLVPWIGWRPVPVLWLLLAAGTAVLVLRTVPVTHVRRPTELLTPTLAGIGLGAGALTASFLAVDARTDAHAAHALVALAVTVVAAAVLVGVSRRRAGIVDPRWLRSPRVVAVVGTVFLANSVNLFFLTFLLLQYRYHQTLLATALALVPAQCAAAAGAVLGGRASARVGCRTAATVALLATGTLSLGALLVTATSPAGVPVAVLTVVAVPAAAAVGPVTEAFLDRTPSGGGTGSAWRTSTANLGVAVGGFVVSAVVFVGLDADTGRTLSAYREQAAAFRLGGGLCAAGAVAAAALLWWAGRSGAGSGGPADAAPPGGVSAART